MRRSDQDVDAHTEKVTWTPKKRALASQAERLQETKAPSS